MLHPVYLGLVSHYIASSTWRRLSTRTSRCVASAWTLAAFISRAIAVVTIDMGLHEILTRPEMHLRAGLSPLDVAGLLLT